MTTALVEMGEFAPLAQALAAELGFRLDPLGIRLVRQALCRRWQQRPDLTPAEHLDLFWADPRERQAMIDLVVVNESWFFRDARAFQQLSLLLEDHRRDASASTQRLRLLSAPCASGEEPYSMAMMLLDRGLGRDMFEIDAIDVSATALTKARQAVYTPYAFRGSSPDRWPNHFAPVSNGWLLVSAARRAVNFHRGTMPQCLDSLVMGYDVVFCRNLLIYLTPSAAADLLERIACLLRPGGLLVVASAEMSLVPLVLFDRQPSPQVGFLRRTELPSLAGSCPRPRWLR